MSKKLSKRAEKNLIARRELQRKLKAQLTDSTPSVSFDLEAVPLEPKREPKGIPGGRCNVTACQREDSAIFLNLGQIGGKHPDTGGCYYCVDCARKIHEANERYSEQDGMTLFPMFKEMMTRYRELWKQEDEDGNRGSFSDRRSRADDFANYKDINQNPWGSCHHWDRDKYLAEQLELTEA